MRRIAQKQQKTSRKVFAGRNFLRAHVTSINSRYFSKFWKMTLLLQTAISNPQVSEKRGIRRKMKMYILFPGVRCARKHKDVPSSALRFREIGTQSGQSVHFAKFSNAHKTLKPLLPTEAVSTFGFLIGQSTEMCPFLTTGHGNPQRT